MRQVRKQKAAASRSPRRSARLIHLASPLPFPLSSPPPPYFRQASSCPHLELVRNVLLDRQLVAHALLHKLWHLRAALVAAKGSAAPPAAGDELEGARANLVAGSGDANHARLAPAAVGGLGFGGRGGEGEGGKQGRRAAEAMGQRGRGDKRRGAKGPLPRGRRA